MVEIAEEKNKRSCTMSMLHSWLLDDECCLKAGTVGAQQMNLNRAPRQPGIHLTNEDIYERPGYICMAEKQKMPIIVVGQNTYGLQKLRIARPKYCTECPPLIF